MTSTKPRAQTKEAAELSLAQPDKAVANLSDEDLFDEIREQVNLARNGPGHNRERTRKLAAEMARRGWRS